MWPTRWVGSAEPAGFLHPSSEDTGGPGLVPECKKMGTQGPDCYAHVPSWRHSSCLHACEERRPLWSMCSFLPSTFTKTLAIQPSSLPPSSESAPTPTVSEFVLRMKLTFPPCPKPLGLLLPSTAEFSTPPHS